MAIYTWLCKCGAVAETAQSIGSYSDIKSRQIPSHCELPMERMLTVNGRNSALANALAGDRYYDGLRAPDGSDISSRTKHREYMKRNGLTVADDYKGEWARAEKERRDRFGGNIQSNRALIEREFTKAEQK